MNMRVLGYSLTRAVCALVIGMILVMFPDQASNYFVITIGVIFLVPSLIGIIAYTTNGKKKQQRFPIEGVGSLLFGLWLIIMPHFFSNLLTIILGFILLMGGIQQLASVSTLRTLVKVSYRYYVVPTLILIAGLVALFNPTGVQRTAFIIIGISCMVYAFSEFVNWFIFTRLQQKSTMAEQRKVNINIEDAEIIE